MHRFYEIGVSETQYLLTLKAMDYRIMVSCAVCVLMKGAELLNELPAWVIVWDQEMEWDLLPAEAARLQEKVESLRKIKIIQQYEEDPMLRRRSQLTYGRLYLNNSVQTFEV